MHSIAEVENPLAAEFERLKAESTREPQWLRAKRESAFDHFEQLGFPTTSDEDWRFTNVDPIAQTAFRSPRGGQLSATRNQIREALFAGFDCHELVFVDGRFAPELSKPGSLPRGVTVRDLFDSLADSEVQRQLGRYADGSKEAFIALNAAFMDCGAVVRIEKETIVEAPIHLVFVSSRASEGTASHPRNLIIAGESCQAAIVESYVGLGSETYFTNAVTEIVAGENSAIEHYMIISDSIKAYNVSTLRVQQYRNSNFASHSVIFGGGLVRNNVHPVLDGEGCQSLLNGLYLVKGRQHVDNFMRVEHAKPHGDSRQFYKGIVDDDGHAVFSGRIIVHKGAQKTDAKQTNMNLLLSDKGQVDTKPQLEIYADDVKCTHGATIGQIDADAVFYLRSRGMTELAARRLLIFAFANESLGRMRHEGIRNWLEEKLTAQLPHGSGLEQKS